MLTVAYGEDWSQHYASIVQPLSPEQAQQRFEARGPFSAILSEAGKVSRVVSFLRDYVGVRFYDAQGRCDLVYDFDEVQPNRLFLTQVWHGKYNTSSHEPAEVAIYRFDPKGTCSIETTALPDRTTRVSPPTQQDVAGNWEPYPHFHDLTSIIRRER
jgi:hypothetical protein